MRWGCFVYKSYWLRDNFLLVATSDHTTGSRNIKSEGVFKVQKMARCASFCLIMGPIKGELWNSYSHTDGKYRHLHWPRGNRRTLPRADQSLSRSTINQSHASYHPIRHTHNQYDVTARCIAHAGTALYDPVSDLDLCLTFRPHCQCTPSDWHELYVY